MLDKKYIDELRDAVNSSPIFYEEGGYIDKYNLTCAVMDRLETSVEYLNSHIDKPKTEEELLIFMMFACMVVDASKELLKCYSVPYTDEDEYQYFKHAYIGEPLNLREEDYPTDDKFFEYFRSLTFAHPYETSRARFIPRGEKQYSPWVIVNDNLSSLFTHIENAVGVRIYFNNRSEIQQLYVSFEKLIGYIQNRYVRIVFITEWIKNEVDRKNAAWAEYQITVTDDDIENLENIRTELERRHRTTYEIDKLISYMSCQCTCEQNNEIVEAYRKEVHNAIPQMVEAVNNFNEDIYEIAGMFLNRTPPNVHQMCNYQLEKIFSYLREDEGPSNVEWGLLQAEAFAKEFAKKWVVILPREMSFEEIKMLVTIACISETR